MAYLMDPEVWMTQDGRKIPYAEMTESHVLNTIAFLERTAPGQKRQYEDLIFAQSIAYDNAHEGWSADWMDEMLDDVMRQTPQQWVESTPAMKALRARAATFGPLAPVKTKIRNTAYNLGLVK